MKSAADSVQDSKPSLESLAFDWLAAKQAEALAVERRRKIGNEITELLRDPNKAEGSISREAGPFKVTVGFGIDRKVDSDGLFERWHELSVACRAAFRWKAEVAAKKFKALSEDDNAIVTAFFESKPSTPSVEIKPLEKSER